jgi:uncharacterized protein (TIGR02246 family)
MTENGSERPWLDTETTAADAIDDLIAHLQRGFDTGDADEYDRLFAADILWGTPKGAVVKGFSVLNRIHKTMMTGTPVQPSSRFELEQFTTPAPGVIVAQIRRRALNGGFSEMALYVLVEHNDRWWLAAGQNTPVAEQLPPTNPGN